MVGNVSFIMLTKEGWIVLQGVTRGCIIKNGKEFTCTPWGRGFAQLKKDSFYILASLELGCIFKVQKFVLALCVWMTKEKRDFENCYSSHVGLDLSFYSFTKVAR